MTFDIYVPLKISEKEQAKIDEALKNGYDSRSKFIRDCINNYDMNTEEMKLRAELRGYNACVTEINTNRDIVLQKLKSVTNTEIECYDVTQNKDEPVEKVTQSNTNPEETTEKVTPINVPENMVTPQSNTNPEEKVEKITQMTDDLLYQRYEQYLPQLSRCLNVTNTVDKKLKERIANDTNTKKNQVGSFIYQYKEQIKEVAYENLEPVKHETDALD